MLTPMFDFSVLVNCFKGKSLRIAADRDFCTVVLNNMTFLFALDVTCSYLPPPLVNSQFRSIQRPGMKGVKATHN